MSCKIITYTTEVEQRIPLCIVIVFHLEITILRIVLKRLNDWEGVRQIEN